MKTIRSIVAGSSHRLPARLKLISTRLGSLLLLFQRMPVVQFLFPEANIIGGASVANTISLAVTTVVGLGVYDSVAGATATITQVSPINSTSEKKVPAAVGSSLTFSFESNAPSLAYSWACTPNPPAPGLVHTNVTFNDIDSITGIPTTAGIYPVNIEVWGDEPSLYKKQAFTIYVLGFTTQPTASQTIPSNTTANLTCAVTGVPTGVTPTYQWYQGAHPSTTIPVGTNSASYTTSALTSTTSYWVKVTSVLSTSTVSVNSSTATVNVSAPLSVLTVAATPSSISEDGASNLAYTFTRTGATTAELTANFSVGGTATFSSDYTQSGAAGFTATTGTVSIPIGSNTATVTIDPTADSTVEPDETAILTVTTGSGYTVGSPAAATGTITNDDTPFSSWASVLPLGQNGPMDTPQGDGVTNLEKFAFNLNPLAPDVRRLTVGANSPAGLPGGAVVGGVLRLEFLRRRADANPNPGITYTVQFGSDLAGWTPIPVGTPAGVAIDGTWERVTVDDQTGGTKRFGRVKVIQTP